MLKETKIVKSTHGNKSKKIDKKEQELDREKAIYNNFTKDTRGFAGMAALGAYGKECEKAAKSFGKQKINETTLRSIIRKTLMEMSDVNPSDIDDYQQMLADRKKRKEMDSDWSDIDKMYDRKEQIKNDRRWLGYDEDKAEEDAEFHDRIERNGNGAERNNNTFDMKGFSSLAAQDSHQHPFHNSKEESGRCYRRTDWRSDETFDDVIDREGLNIPKTKHDYVGKDGEEWLNTDHRSEIDETIKRVVRKKLNEMLKK